MFCTKCGKEIEKDAKFCTACGAPVAQTENEAVVNDAVITEETAPIAVPAFESEQPEIAVPTFETEETAAEEAVGAYVVSQQGTEKAAPAPAKKPVNKGLLWGLIGGGAALLIILVCVFVWAYLNFISPNQIRFGMTPDQVERVIEKAGGEFSNSYDEYDYEDYWYLLEDGIEGITYGSTNISVEIDEDEGVFCVILFPEEDEDEVLEWLEKRYGADWDYDYEDERYIWEEDDVVIMYSAEYDLIRFYDPDSSNEQVDSYNEWYLY